MLRLEKKLYKKGFKHIAGLDEAGRGPLAGPVVAAIVIINPLIKLKDFRGVKDSKELSVKKREYFFNLIINNPYIDYKITKVSEKIIDKINILQATKKAMERLIKKLNPDFLIIDGNFKLKTNILQKSVIRGDKKILSCTLASVLAKVYRDKLMEKYDKEYPLYKFSKHKGYPTKEHYSLIKKYGVCKIHRKSFLRT
ncbi:MAG: ribonuclease HII [Candidatus Pacebacteria bacterium]|nr:ribonuclease HII [Candidatus Paceibacterota bacterium]